MSATVISVQNVSKCYRLGLIGGGTLHDDFERWWAKARGRPDPLLKIGQEDQSNGQGEYIWALRDVSIEVKEGEVLGIIGRNGAGKSTLLKILSRVTAPTAGQVKIKGRVASLLEVGTGFHPELTGRENIYLNGAILGMKKAEIERKFDEIVAFSEVEKFIDTPLKRYSSGMYVRLAFAVAAHLEPEILLIDEVLAVGDAIFQQKCLTKMDNVAKEGRTVLFVSHNLQAIEALCQRAIFISNGKIQCTGSASDSIALYLQRGKGGQILERNIEYEPRRPGEGTMFRITKVRISFPSARAQLWEPIEFCLDFKCLASQCKASPSIEVWRLDGVCAFTSDAEDDGMVLDLVRNTVGTVRVIIPNPNLPPGRYIVRAVARSGGSLVIDWVNEALVFDIFPLSNVSIRVSEKHLGTRPRGHWSLQNLACP
jgi:ABC-type polysaccharide/polyol phosphate transport system ATPase subunit